MFDGSPNNEPNYYPGGDAPAGPSGPSIGSMMGDAGYYAGAAKDGLGGMAGKVGSLKKYIPFIIGGVVVLIVLLFVLSWFGSQQTITFSASALDGGMLGNAKLVIKSGGTALQGLKPVDGSYTVTLAPGTYEYYMSSSGYKKSDSVSLTIPDPSISKDAGNQIVVSLPKDISATLSVAADADSIYKSLPVTGTITVTNTGSDMINGAELVAVSSSSDANKPSSTSPRIDLNFSPSTFDLSGNGGQFNISFTATLAGTLTTAKDITKRIRIKGTNITADLKLSAVPSVASKDVLVTPSDILSDYALEAGVRKIVTSKITITNKNTTIPLNDVRVEITAKDGSESNLSWVSLDQAETGEAAVRVLPTIAPKDKVSLTFFLEPPANTAVNDAFSGNLVISSPSIDTPISVPVEFKVSKAKFSELTLNVSSISIPCDKTALTCPMRSSAQSVKLKNTGTENLSNISVEIDSNSSDADCGTWIDLKTTSIPSLATTEEAPILMDITPAYDLARAYENCYLAWRYNDPLESKIIRIVSLKPFTITKS